jgi:hypothetical protein
MQRLRDAGEEVGAQALQAELERVDAEIADVTTGQPSIRAGYVYVISNVGSFGEGSVEIGMTRRLAPMHRVRELGDASVLSPSTHCSSVTTRSVWRRCCTASSPRSG